MRALSKPILKKKFNARYNHTGGLNFDLSTEQLAFREMAREFSRKKILPAAAALDVYVLNLQIRFNYLCY